jgi:hypothetical protein
MTLVYVFIIALLLYIQKVYGKKLLTILSGIVILLIITITSSDSLKYIVVTLTQKVITDEYVIKYILIITLLYLISELLIVLGFQNILLDLIEGRSVNRQKFYMHLLSTISTNVDNDYLLTDDQNRNAYESSAFINSMLNIISIPFLTIVLLIMSVISQETEINLFILLLISTNFFAIFWFFKRTIDFKNDITIDYQYYEDHLIKKGNHADVQSVSYNGFKFFFVRNVVYLLVAISTGFYFQQVALFLITFLSLVFIDLFIIAEFFVFNHKEIEEKIIYVSIFNGIKKVFNDVITILAGMMFVILASDLLLKYTGFSNTQNLNLFILSIGFCFFVTYFTKNYIFGLIFTTPLISLIYSNYLVDSFSINILILFVAVLTIAQHMAIIKVSLTNRDGLIDLFYHMGATAITYIIFIISSNIFWAFLAMFIFLVVYRYIIIKFFVNKTI